MSFHMRLASRRAGLLPPSLRNFFAQRHFVDAPVTVDVSLMPEAGAGVGETSSSPAVEPTYVYPLDAITEKINLYGENTSYAVDDSNRVISSNRLHSYDPSVLSNELRLQDYNVDTPVHKDSPEVKDEVVDENDAVMREGRNKQGAAGAAAVAAAMLESRRAVDGIALVPGHPLPVVFPRPDDLPPPLRFIKKFGPGSGRQTNSSAGRSSTSLAEEKNEMEEEDGIYSEVMESASHAEAHSFHNSFVFEVRVLDEQHRPAKVKGFHHFSELSDILPPLVQRGLAINNFNVPTLMQSAALPLLMMGKDIICVAPPTSGRTYCIAIRSLVVLEKAHHSLSTSAASAPGGGIRPGVLVVCATTETARRMSSAYHVLGGDEVRVQTIFSGKDEEKQNDELRLCSECGVLVATAARLAAAVRDGLVHLTHVHFVAVFETNRILEDAASKAGLEESLNLVKVNPVPHQVSLWCSSISSEVDGLTGRFLSASHRNTVIVSKEEKVHANVRQILYALKRKEERLECVWKLYDSRAILKREQVLIFCLYKETAEALAKSLTASLEAPSSLVQFLHSGLGRSKQKHITRAFQHGDIRVLITTDVAARRLDVPELEHVINYDLPPTTELLARRMRHAGRAGRSATIHTFLTDGDGAVPMTAKFISEQTGQALSAEIQEVVQRIEASAGADSWSTPVIRANDHMTGLNTRWRVKGHLDDAPTTKSERTVLGRNRPPLRIAGKAQH